MKIPCCFDGYSFLIHSKSSTLMFVALLLLLEILLEIQGPLWLHINGKLFLFFSLFFCVLFLMLFWHKVLPCSLCWPQTHCLPDLASKSLKYGSVTPGFAFYMCRHILLFSSFHPVNFCPSFCKWSIWPALVCLH